MIHRSSILFAIAAVALAAGAQAADSHAIRQMSRTFIPSEVSIAQGDVLAFSNQDDFIHQIYVKSDAMNFDSNEQSPGQVVTIGFPAAGTFAVRCHIHPRMLLVVHVK